MCCAQLGVTPQTANESSSACMVKSPRWRSIRPDGSDLRMLGEGHDPTLSPDGRSICYTGHPPEGGVTVYVMAWDGTGSAAWFPPQAKGATFPNWSPIRVRSFTPFGKATPSSCSSSPQTAPDCAGSPNWGNSVCTPAAWSPDGTWISSDERTSGIGAIPERMWVVYVEKPADKRPVWVIRPMDPTPPWGTLRYQMAIDGSRASWKPQLPDVVPHSPKFTPMTTITLVGAGGKMGCRITDNLPQNPHRVHYPRSPTGPCESRRARREACGRGLGHPGCGRGHSCQSRTWRVGAVARELVPRMAGIPADDAGSGGTAGRPASPAGGHRDA